VHLRHPAYPSASLKSLEARFEEQEQIGEALLINLTFPERCCRRIVAPLLQLTYFQWTQKA
jgi:hypothetical protein